VMFEATTRYATGLNTSAGKVLLSGWTETVDILFPATGREYSQVPGVEEPAESDGGGIRPDSGEGVAHEVGRASQTETFHCMQHHLVAFGEANDNAFAAPVAQLTADWSPHDRSGFLTGRPQIPQGRYAAPSWQMSQGANAHPSNRLPQAQSHSP